MVLSMPFSSIMEKGSKGASCPSNHQSKWHRSFLRRRIERCKDISGNEESELGNALYHWYEVGLEASSMYV